jgi:ADP-ribose pyrophosphatase
MDTRVLPWRVVGTRELARTPVFRLTARESSHPRLSDRRQDFYVLEAPEWVNVIPLTDDRQVVLIRQYRHGRAMTSLEIPGGMVDPEDVDPAAAARRELLEETGYLAGKVEPIGTIAPNPAIQSNLCHSFCATELTYRGVPELDSTEEVEVLQVPLQRVPELIRSGSICHALVVVAFCHLLGLTVD